MPSKSEIPITLQRWRGTNIAHDEAFVDPSFLRRSDNWVPDQTFLLSKRRGTAAFRDVDTDIDATDRIHAMLRVYSGSTRYLYAVRNPTTGNDEVILSTDDGAFASVSNGSFSVADSRYGMTVFSSQLYVGNGTDPIKRIPFGGAAVDLSALASLSTTGASVSVETDATSTLTTGQYSYAWAIYDTSTKQWISRSAPAVITISTTRSRLNFTAPTASAGTNRHYRLFVAPANLPIEYSHDQFAEGITGGASGLLITDINVSSAPIPAAQSVVRTGRFLTVHRSRLWAAGDQSGLRNVYASNIILPSLEQAVFDQIEFFPANAVIVLPEEVTGISPVTVGASQEQPQSPLGIFSETSTWMFFGDILDDPDAELIRVSGQVGCISHLSIVPIPSGLIFCGRGSVYLLRPDLAAVVDIGWPIAPAIRDIPRSLRSDVHATYHKGFYKLAVIPAGALTPTRQWWLDLRNGLTNPPSWWGPHTTVAYSAMTTAARDTAEDDRGFGAVEGGGTILLLDQTGSYKDDTTDIVSSLQTQGLGSQKPFQRKQFRRVRVNGRASPATTLATAVQTDSGVIHGADPIALAGATGGEWNSATWRVSEWGSLNFVEGESLFEPRPRGVSAKIILTHAEASRIDLREFELRYEPEEREVA